MSARLTTGGRFTDRSKQLGFSFNGKRLTGYAGDTLASALLANDQILVGRSYKFHRPRGIVASGAEEPNALIHLGSGNRFEPDQRATTTELFDGLVSESQNHWPSLETDVGAINARLARFLPAGFYYKTFLWPRGLWKHLYEPVIRQAAGLGRAPDAESRDADRYEHFHVHVDLLVIGGGVAGLMAAKTAAEAGAQVLLVEQTAHWGGRAPVDGGVIDSMDPDAWVAQTVAALEAMPNVRMRLRLMGAAVQDHGHVLGYERVSDHAPGSAGPRHRLWRIRARQVIAATGAIERPLSFAGNDVPGVMLAAAMRDYVVNFGVIPGRRTVVVTNNDDGYRTAICLVRAGLEVPAILDARPYGGGKIADEARALGIRIEPGRAVSKVLGTRRVTGVASCLQIGEGSSLEDIPCDAVAMSGGWSPVVHLWSHTGGKLMWDEAGAFFRPDPERAPTGADGLPFVLACGAANGALALPETLRCAAQTGVDAARRLGIKAADAAAPPAQTTDESSLMPVWIMPAKARADLRMKAFLDYQNDVKVSDVQLAAREGYESVEHTKRYTTLGMASDQGKLSNINGLGILSDALGKPIPQVGTTTFRPPYTPISFGAIAGEARGEMFQPLRRTPMQDWHAAHGAAWEIVGQWRRPYCYPQTGESKRDAVNREINAARGSLGVLDASTLGKILVKGPDAGKFLDMMYTNMMSTLPVGKCRYGLMCNENGFLMDDGVVVRLTGDSWLCHTTSGGADHVHAHMENWLQCEWWDWKVYTVNLTEQYAQIAVVGPNARKLLEKLGGMDVSKDALPFLQWADGRLADTPVRVYRISFSGELCYEIAIPANRGRAFWDKLIQAGAEWNITPYGTEALHVMRAEKGFIMIGDESDGTVIPQDLGLGWAISKKKTDYLGKRAQERPDMVRGNRWQLVGLETPDGSVLPDGAYAVAAGKNANGQRNVQGRVTSTYYSPTLTRGIAMGLVENGPGRMGETIWFTAEEQEHTTRKLSLVEAKIVSPVFFDPKGEKQDV
ncbi:sarcosine oxidase subunit alpha family protein [Salipiger aestuarii]|uniref:sarcosine oxidase subunit alpha family protein n=1 Tax=Salipiger aestuarii TaxID=568098 RepID=UPI00123ABBE2|nr:sarcosine oxidase subunit alpha family protein [Salipiger aestuarii]KAA8613109.1 sarcosine oxidase subunit alpha [Salipiger aestuarii]